MVGPACVGLAGSPYMAIALFCVGGFAHQTLSGALYSITSDTFGRHEVATVTGLGGMFGYLGAAAFTVLLGLNGAGKTTLFALITRLYSARAGHMSVFGHDVERASN